MDAILAVGPRDLPADGLIQVWLDSGSGSGHEVVVSAPDLAVADLDDGQGRSALYTLRVRECRG
jgi:hypothetical protein